MYLIRNYYHKTQTTADSWEDAIQALIAEKRKLHAEAISCRLNLADGYCRSLRSQDSIILIEIIKLSDSNDAPCEDAGTAQANLTFCCPSYSDETGCSDYSKQDREAPTYWRTN